MNGKVINKQANKKQTVFALIRYENNTFGVYKLCSNYDGMIRGGIRKTWRLVQKSMTEEKARNLYNRRLNGTQR